MQELVRNAVFPINQVPSILTWAYPNLSGSVIGPYRYDKKMVTMLLTTNKAVLMTI